MAASERDCRRAWLTSVKPWLRAVICSAFFIISLAQSIMFLCKYVSGPQVTVTTFEDVGPAETPWMTVCPIPGYNVSRNDEILASLPLAEVGGALALDGTYLPNIGRAVTRLNMTVDDYLDQVASPTWVHMSSCAVQFPGVAAVGNGRCALTAPSTTGGNETRRNLRLTEVFGAEVESKLGVWETFPAMLSANEPYLYFCSTFKPNFSLNANETEAVVMRFRLALRPNYFVSPRTAARALLDGGHARPRYAFFVTSPNSPLFPYGGVKNRRLSSVPTYAYGQKASLELKGVTRYQLLSTESEPCHGQGSYKERHQCLLVCFEAEYLGDGCRIPGPRNHNMTPVISSGADDDGTARLRRFKPVRVCQTWDDYLWLTARVQGAGAARFYDRCRSLCGARPCTFRRYDLADAGQRNVMADWGDGVLRNFTGAWNDSSAVRTTEVALLAAGTGTVTVMRQEWAYDVHQLLGEVGGTWGLFLGLSLVNVFGFVEDLVLRRAGAPYNDVNGAL